MSDKHKLNLIIVILIVVSLYFITAHRLEKDCLNKQLYHMQNRLKQMTDSLEIEYNPRVRY